jgi:chloride channel protein, CIC family
VRGNGRQSLGPEDPSLQIGAGLALALVLLKIINHLRPKLKALPRRTQYLQPAAAGLVIGLIGIWLPQVMGAGYGPIDRAMHDRFTWQMMAVLAAFKIATTTLSFVSGAPGGMFAPALFIGAMVGGAVGGVERHFFPALTGSVGAYALVGMGTLFSGFLRVPMTSVFMVLEISGDYSIILPVMISNTLAYLISRKYQRTPLFDLLARQDGVELPSMEEAREESSLRVEDAMRPIPSLVLRGEESFKDALRRVDAAPEQYFLVNQALRGWSLVTREQLRWQVDKGDADARLEALPETTRLPWLHPDQHLDDALRRVGDWPALPVVSRADFQRLEGIVSLSDILKTFGVVSGKAG